MKVCVSAAANSLDASIDPRFGRCPYFIIVDSETMQFEVVSNLSSDALSGAGIQAAQTVASKGVTLLITGNVGPNALQALSAAGIKVVTATGGTVREAVEKYKKGELEEVPVPTVGGHFRGRTGRRGLRRGR
jgi:predicted Fe-Mo cluster-binding NifX family protein